MKDLTKDEILEKVIRKIKKLIKEYCFISYYKFSGEDTEELIIDEINLLYYKNKELIVSYRGYNIGEFPNNITIQEFVEELKSIELNRQKEKAFKYLDSK